MESLKIIQALSRVGAVLSKIAFVFAVIGFCGGIAGVLGLSLGDGELIKIGGVTLHGLTSENSDYNAQSVAAALVGFAIVCAGEAVVARFAASYFQNELRAGTPFTRAGSGEILRLGILTLTVPVGCTVVGSVVEGIFAGLWKVEKLAGTDAVYDNAASVALGVMFLVISFLCRYGAEIREGGASD